MFPWILQSAHRAGGGSVDRDKYVQAISLTRPDGPSRTNSSECSETLPFAPNPDVSQHRD